MKEEPVTIEIESAESVFNFNVFVLPGFDMFVLAIISVSTRLTGVQEMQNCKKVNRIRVVMV